MLNQRPWDSNNVSYSADPNKKRAQTQERSSKPIVQSANASMIGGHNFNSDAPMNPADYISEDFLQVLEVSI